MNAQEHETQAPGLTHTPGPHCSLRGETGCLSSLVVTVVGGNGEGNGTPLLYSCLEIPWTEEPGGLQSMGSLRAGHD